MKNADFDYWKGKHCECLSYMPFQQSYYSRVKSIFSIVSQTKFQSLHPGWGLVTHWQQKDGSVISRQFVLLNIKTRPSWPYVSKAASFPVASLFLYPAATHCYCHICPLAHGIECSASPEATVNASFLLYWLEMHLASSVSNLSSLFFNRHQALK